MVKQLQQLKELVHNALERIRTLEHENVELKEKLQGYENNLDGLSQENKALENSQQQIELSVGELLGELQGLNLDSLQPQKIEAPEETTGLEHRSNVEPKQVRESAKNLENNVVPEKPSTQDEDLSHSLDVSLGLSGDSLLEDNKPVDDEELEIF